MAYYGADLDETPRWRLSILFLFVVILSLVGHIGLHKLQDYFKKHKRIGLKHTLQTLQDELFALGLITLLLITLQDQILKICVSGSSGSDDEYSGTKNRKLQASYDYTCPKGEESFWSLTALHEIHILIFLIAVVHLAQAALSMILAGMRVQRWKRYEDRVCHDMVPLKRKGAIKPKGRWVVLWVWSFFTQFSDSVDGAVYLAIRRFFIEKMELDDSFNFYNYVVDTMEEDFAKCAEFQWIMWLIAAVWILLPWQAYTIIWFPCVMFLVMLIVGAKLQSVAIQIATLAYTHYTPNFMPKKKGKSAIKKASSKKLQTARPETAGGDVELGQVGAAAVQVQKTNKASEIEEFMAQTYLLTDSSSLFWFGKPKLMLVIFQYVYFVSGLVVALLILDEWRGQKINHLTDNVVYILMIVVNVIMMVHAALFVLPTYAITIAAGAYGPENILKKALKKNVNPELAKKLNLERKSQTSTLDSDMESIDGESTSHHGHGHGGHGHGGGDVTGRINYLLEAMDHSQARKKQTEDQPSSSGHADSSLHTISSNRDAERMHNNNAH